MYTKYHKLSEKIQFVFSPYFMAIRSRLIEAQKGGNPKNPNRLLIAATCNPPPKPKCCGGVTAPRAGVARKKGQTDNSRRRGACVCLSQRRDARVTAQRQEQQRPDADADDAATNR